MSRVRRSDVDLVLQAPAHPAIDRGKRLVEQQHGRLARQRPRERDALTLAARQLDGRRVIWPRQMDAMEQRLRAAPPFGARPVPERRHHIAHGAQVRERAHIPERRIPPRDDAAA